MFERPQTGERAITVAIGLNGRAPEAADLSEFQQLVLSTGARLVAAINGRRQQPDPKYYVGSGKVDEIYRLAEAQRADLILFNHALSPAQERNLESTLQRRVLDRTGLILDIFAQRAHTFEGKLQVELAQLEHLSTRLVRGWTHLERQKGGIGLRGPGETQLETDRRLLGQRIKQIRKRLAKVGQQRHLGRDARRRSELATVSLVGYTNAGKSTLFNRLTDAKVFAADQLFATLDPTIRRVVLPGSGPMVLADTVGFIRQLPHDLVAAFKATLEETRQARLLLHVVDASSPHRDRQVEQVNEVINAIGAGEVPQLMVYNKTDLLHEPQSRSARDGNGRIQQVWVSSRTGAGFDLLIAALQERLGEYKHRRWLWVAHHHARVRAALYEAEAVLSEVAEAHGWLLRVGLSDAQLGRLADVTEFEIVPETALREFDAAGHAGALRDRTA